MLDARLFELGSHQYHQSKGLSNNHTKYDI